MNVLFLINHAGGAGTEKYVRVTALGLREAGHRAFICYNEPGELSAWAESNGFPAFRLNMRSRYDMRAAREIAALCRVRGIDIIHAQYEREVSLAALAKSVYRRVKIVFTVHILKDDPLPVKIFNALICSPLTAVTIRVGAHGEEQLKRNGFKRTAEVLNGTEIPPAPVKRTPGGVFTFVCSARLAPEKGHAFMFEGVRRLAEITDKPFRVLVAGTGGLRAELEKNAPPQVEFSGYIRDMAAFYGGADANLLTSLDEYCSYALIEGLSYGLPAVTTDIPANAGVIGESAGFTIPYGDADAFANACLKLMTDGAARERMSRAARKLAEEKFDCTRQIAETIELYESVTGERT